MKDEFKMNLQLFAEPAEGGPEAEAGGTPTEGHPPEGQPTEGQPQLFTQEDVERIINRRHAQFERELEQRLAQARGEGRAEAERLARMTEAERAEHDAQAAREREEQFARREANLTRRELRADAIDALTSRGLPRELEQLIDYTSAESRDRSIETLENTFRAAVQQGVDERIHQSRAPLPKPGGDASAATREKMRAALGLK